MIEDNMVVLEVCPDYIAADLLAGLLKSESIRAVVRNRSFLPGLELGAEVLVPAASLARARLLLTAQRPTDAELTELATGESPERAHTSGK